MNGISLAGLDKASVLAALYNASRPLGMGFLQYDPKPMTIEEAKDILTHQTYFDYLKGRVMKIDLSEDSLRTRLYDRDNGEGAAEAVLGHLRETGKVSGGGVKAMHTQGLKEEIKRTRDFADTPTTFGTLGAFAILQLGGEDVAEELGAALDRAEEV